MHSSGKRKLYKTGVLRLGSTPKTAFILVTVINAKVTKTKASFLAFKAIDIWKHNTISGYNSNKSAGLCFF